MNTGQDNGSQMRITKDEMSLLKSTFEGNESLLKLLRKLFLPELDPSAPIGQMIDLWLTVNLKDKTPEQAYIDLLSRNQLISHVDNVLMQIKIISKRDDLTIKELEKKMSKNSNK